MCIMPSATSLKSMVTIHTEADQKPGHGVGLDIHELPSVGENEALLEAGNVITIEPGLYYPEIGGIRLEDMVLVTENGCQNLTGLEKRFVL